MPMLRTSARSFAMTVSFEAAARLGGLGPWGQLRRGTTALLRICHPDAALFRRGAPQRIDVTRITRGGMGASLARESMDTSLPVAPISLPPEPHLPVGEEGRVVRQRPRCGRRVWRGRLLCRADGLRGRRLHPPARRLWGADRLVGRSSAQDGRLRARERRRGSAAQRRRRRRRSRRSRTSSGRAGQTRATTPSSSTTAASRSSAAASSTARSRSSTRCSTAAGSTACMPFRPLLFSGLATAHALRGDLHAAQHWLHQAHATVSHAKRGALLLADAIVAVRTGRPRDALAMMDAGWAQAEGVLSAIQVRTLRLLRAFAMEQARRRPGSTRRSSARLLAVRPFPPGAYDYVGASWPSSRTSYEGMGSRPAERRPQAVRSASTRRHP